MTQVDRTRNWNLSLSFKLKRKTGNNITENWKLYNQKNLIFHGKQSVDIVSNVDQSRPRGKAFLQLRQ